MEGLKEIGGYIELDTYTGKMLHEDGIKLNNGRSGLAYILKANKIDEIAYPIFMCDACDRIMHENDIKMRRYSVGTNFKPILDKVPQNCWLYLVNYYGQLTEEDVLYYQVLFGGRIILDNAQAYFDDPIHGINTIYTCRKFFGVADGGILYTNNILMEEIPVDESHNRMHFLLGRYESLASEFYREYVDNNEAFYNEPIKQMSRLTENLLHGLDYDFIRQRRTDNFAYLHDHLCEINKLTLHIPNGAFMYPLYLDDGVELRKRLLSEKVYIPTLWPNVLDNSTEAEIDYQMAANILPLPVDQRYNSKDMEYLVNMVRKYIG